LILAAAWFSWAIVCGAAADESFDIVIYSATPGGVTAAIQARRMGKTCVLIEPGKHVGGMTSGGLGATDIGNKGAIGGLAREFYRRIKSHYDQPQAWKYETAEAYRSTRQRPGEDTMWTFEPHVAERVFRTMLTEAGVRVVFGQRLDLARGVQKEGTRIAAIRMEGGQVYRGAMFIDASYEGDLLALAGVSYHVGREANATYGETLNGVQTRNATKHQFTHRVDPFVTAGDPSSGLLLGVHGGEPGEEGAGDQRVQAYCFRLCATDVPANRRPWPKPADYDERRYELLLRNFEAGDHRIPWNPILMPNRKTDSNNNYAISTDNIGMNYEYPNGDYATREKIIREHESYQQGLMWTLANHPRVPEKVRRHFQTWGLAKDEFTDHGNWPHQLYIREARRMIGQLVMTQHHCQGRQVAPHSVGLAAYTMDSHNVQRYVRDGAAINEGDVQVGGFPPYPIGYGAIVPQESQCTNLLVPVCLSASHIAYGSIRMEPVFMVLGQSAATAAVQAMEQQTSVQKICPAQLRERLLADRQVLEWAGPPPAAGVDPAKLKGIVVDDSQAELTGTWLASSAIAGFVGRGYLHDNNEGQGKKTAKYTPEIPQAGVYEVRLWYTANPNRATRVRVHVHAADGEKTIEVNQRHKAETGEGSVSLGTARFAPGRQGYVLISNARADGHVIADAVQFVARE
jgi:hypothetical protein